MPPVFGCGGIIVCHSNLSNLQRKTDIAKGLDHFLPGVLFIGGIWRNPKYIIPANRKWYRNLVISKILINTLEDLKMSYPEPEENLDSVVIDD